jgi:hypothetical protein
MPQKGAADMASLVKVFTLFMALLSITKKLAEIPQRGCYYY